MIHEFKENADFTDNMSFGQFLKKKRRLLGLNQTDLSEIIGVNQKTVSMWEIEVTSPQIEDARKIIECLGAELKIVNHPSEMQDDAKINELVSHYMKYGYSETIIKKKGVV